MAQIRLMAERSIWPRRHLQLAVRKLTASHLGECVHLRNRVGFKTAFIEDEQFSLMLGMVKSFKGQGAMIKRAAMEETQEKARKDLEKGSQEEMVRQLVGPRGGLPSLKADLVRLATLLHVQVDPKDTVEQLKKKIKGPLGAMKGGSAAASSSTSAVTPAKSDASKFSPVRRSAMPWLPVTDELPPPLAKGQRGQLEGDLGGLQQAMEVELMTSEEMDRQNHESLMELAQMRFEAQHGPEADFHSLNVMEQAEWLP